MTDPMIVIAPEGEVTMATLGRLMAETRVAGRKDHITLDLAQMTTCDSALMAWITTLRADCEKRGVVFAIKSAPDTLYPLAEIYGLTDFVRQSIRV